MATIRQRKTEQAPSSRGAMMYMSDDDREMTRVVTEDVPAAPSSTTSSLMMEFDSYYTSPPPPLTMIPDKEYKNFLLGKSSKLKSQGMCPDGRTCAGRCIGFSWVAVAFLFMIAVMMDTQPIFIKGIQPKGDRRIEGVTYKVSTRNQQLPATASAYHAAYAYLFTILLCVAYLRNFFTMVSARIRRMKRRHYEDIPEDNGSPRRDATLPMYSTMADAHEAYANNNKGAELWNRLVINIKNITKKLRKPARNKRRRE